MRCGRDYVVPSRRSSAAFLFFFFFNDTATTEIYTLSLHDALPISQERIAASRPGNGRGHGKRGAAWRRRKVDRKSTRLNSSHGYISYAVFCLKKKKKKTARTWIRHNRQHRVRTRRNK